MKTSGVSCETKFGLLGFLGHPNDQGVVVEDGQGVGGGRYSEGGVCPGVVWGRALLNLA